MPSPVKANANFRVVAVVVASALFMQNLDGTIVATALPAMSRDLHVSAVHLSAAITAYLVALTVFIPVSGWVADRFGARRVFMSAIAIFTASSCLCALSPDLGWLVAARVLQGLGGAMMVPVGRLLLLRTVRREELLSATTWLTLPALLGPMLGPPLGGLMTDTLSWQSVFWINLPVGAIGLLLTWRLVPASAPAPREAPDLAGMSLMGAALTAIMIGTETFGRGMLPGWVPLVAIALGLALFRLAMRHCRRVANPAIDFSLLSIPTFKAATLPAGLFRAGAGALPFLMPLTLQLGFGLSAARSGLIVLASALGSLCMRALARRAMRLATVRQVLVASSVSFALTLAICATVSARWPDSAIFVLLLCAGLTRSLGFAVMGAIAFADVPQEKLSLATSFQGTAQQLPKAAGVSLAAATIQASMLLGGRAHAGRLDFALAFLAIAVLVLIAAPMFAALAPNAGAGIDRSGPRSASKASPGGDAEATRHDALPDREKKADQAHDGRAF